MKIEILAHQFVQLSAVDQGVTVVRAEDMEESLSELRKDAARYEYFHAIGHTKTNVTQNFSSCGEFGAGSIWRSLAIDIGLCLSREFARSGQSKMFESPLHFTDIALQKYPQTPEGVRYGISPHRDQSAFVNLVAVLLISGPSAFFVCKDKAGAGASDVMARPGDLILMRGGGYGQGLPRPYHFIGKIDDPRERLSFGMRQISSDPAKAAELRNMFSPKEEQT